MSGYFDETLLHVAAREGELEVVRLLLAKGANTSHTGRTGVTPIAYAIDEGQVAVVDLLLQHDVDIDSVCAGSDRTPLLYAASEGQVEVVQFLLKKGADVNSTNMDGMTPYDLAVAGGNTALAKLLVMKGGLSGSFLLPPEAS
ncbi:hypothetical protein CI102_15090 [Trichoderma harzianum]|nr:hypothetical protein CI102_15090 [Trichoderma harzianum]